MNKTNFFRPAKGFSVWNLCHFLSCLVGASCCISQLCLPVFAGKSKPVIELVEDKRPRADFTRVYLTRAKITIAIEHLGGIGKAEIILKEGQWPKKVLLQFRHFQAIEGIKIIAAEKRFEASISTSSPRKVLHLEKGFTASRKSDSFLIGVPQNFLNEKVKCLRIEWIDFYRN